MYTITVFGKEVFKSPNSSTFGLVKILLRNSSWKDSIELFHNNTKLKL